MVLDGIGRVGNPPQLSVWLSRLPGRGFFSSKKYPMGSFLGYRDIRTGNKHKSWFWGLVESQGRRLEPGTHFEDSSVFLWFWGRPPVPKKTVRKNPGTKKPRYEKNPVWKNLDFESAHGREKLVFFWWHFGRHFNVILASVFEGHFEIKTK